MATNAGGPHALKYGVTGAWVAGMEVVLAPGELVQVGGWAGKDVAGYDLKSLLIGSEGTLGVLTAVRLRLLPAPEEALTLVVFLGTREQGCAAIEAVFAAGLRPSVLDFLDGETLRALAGSYPAAVDVGTAAEAGMAADAGAAADAGIPREAGFALVCEVDGTSEEARAQRASLLELMSGPPAQALAVHEPADTRALWRWRDGANPAVTAVRGGKVSEDVVFPVERLAEGLARFELIASEHGARSCAWGHGGDGNVHATVLVDPASEAELDAAEAVGEELFGLVVELGGSIAGEHGVGWHKRGRLESQWHARALDAARADQACVRPEGPVQPREEAGTVPCAVAGYI